MGPVLLVYLWIFPFLLFSSELVNAGSREAGHVFVKEVRLEGNFILDDAAFNKPFNMGAGIYLRQDLIPLIAEEVESFYSSHGFHRVRANVPVSKSRRGVLTVSIYEEKEIREGKSDMQRAEVAINRLVIRNKLQPDMDSREKAVATLIEAYRIQRIRDLEAEKRRFQAEKSLAKVLRERYLGVLEEKRKAEIEGLKSSKDVLLSIFASQQKFINDQKKEEAKRLIKMRQRIRSILDTKLNDG